MTGSVGFQLRHACALLGALFALALAAPAVQAATVGVQGSTLVYTAAPGEVNLIRIYDSSVDSGAPVGTNDPHLDIEDSVAITPGAGCAAHSNPYGYGADVRCESAGITRVQVDGADGDDQIYMDRLLTLAAVVLGGSGNDKITGGGLADSIQAGDGNDIVNRIEGGIANGDGGNDRIDGGEGNDKLGGGAGDDILTGGGGDDEIYGDESGLSGNDQIDGGDGADKLYGMYGDDRIGGGAGNDFLSGQDGNDALDGGSGDDEISGGADQDALGDTGGGTDTFNGDTGNDNINSRDGVGSEPVNCGSGADTATVDANDIVSVSDPGSICETIDTGSGATTPPPPDDPFVPDGGIGDLDPLLINAGQTLRFRDGRFSVPAQCVAACTIKTTGTNVSVPGPAQVYRLPPVVKTLSAAGTTKLRLKPQRKARRAIARSLKRGRRVTARLWVTSYYADGTIGGPWVKKVRLRK